MAKERFLWRGSDSDPDGNTFYRHLMFTVGGGDTVDRCIFWAHHWAVNEQGWDSEGPNNSWVQSITFTQGPNTAPVPTPPQPTGNPIYPGIIWYGVFPLTFNNWTQSNGTNSINNQWLQGPAEGIETKGKRLVANNSFGGIWYQLAQYRQDESIPFNIWSTRVTMFLVILSQPNGFSAERKEFYMDQVEMSGDMDSEAGFSEA